ncbi:MAG: response regulator [Chloroflexi bacterium]|nr:response regulator [Chloroflexota bacterium]
MIAQDIRQRFLVVDDDHSLRTVLSIALESRSDAEVIGASDGLEALRLIESMDLSVVFVDLLMPKMTGAEMLNALNDHPNLPKIVVMTALEEALADQPLADQSLVAQLRYLGASKVLKKPFHIGEFFSVVDELTAVAV